MWSRELAKNYLIPFTQYRKPDYQVGIHHRLIASKLEQAERRAPGDPDRIMILTPPRHGKSELGSRSFPAWWLGRNPKDQIIQAAYNMDFATDFGEDVRDIVDSEEFHALFSTQLKKDARKKNKWKTNKGGVYIAAGVDTSVTGRGAHLFNIDDPIKDDKQAMSETVRENIWNWYSSVAYTRLMPGAVIVLIMTRWHEDDLSGRLIDRMKNTPGADQWDILDLPAMDPDRPRRTYSIVPARLPTLDDCNNVIEGYLDKAMKGQNDSTLPAIVSGNFKIRPKTMRFKDQSIWPEWWGEEKLARVKANITERHWSALYMQQPSPDDGLFFKRKWFRYWVQDEEQAKGDPGRYVVLPSAGQLRIYGASDYATDETTKADYTVHGIFGVDHRLNIYMLHIWRDKKKSKDWVEALLNLMQGWSPDIWFEENGQIIKALDPYIKQEMEDKKIFTPRRQLNSINMKEIRALTAQGLIEQGRFFFPLWASWLDDAVKEMLAFPKGKNDDIVDVISLFMRAINTVMKGSKPDKAVDVQEIKGVDSMTLDDLFRLNENLDDGDLFGTGL